jgi:membrane protease subunit HflC
MSKTQLAILGIVVLVLGVIASASLFTVHQVQQAIVLQFGKPVRVVQEPGLSWKLPFIQDVRFYERRILDLDPPEFEVLLDDKKRIKVDAFARYTIDDPLRFLQVVGSEATARNRLSNLVNSSLRRVIAKTSLTDLLSSKRGELMEQIQTEVTGNAKGLGINIVDIRIGRTDLPTETSQAVFNRMRTEREREARELRAQGTETAQKIRAGADRDKTVILANAKRKSEQLRGEGEGERNLILGRAYGQDPEFFQFYKSLAEYQENLVGNDTTMVLSPDSDFFRFFGNLSGEAKK